MVKRMQMLASLNTSQSTNADHEMWLKASEAASNWNLNLKLSVKLKLSGTSFYKKRKYFSAPPPLGLFVSCDAFLRRHICLVDLLLPLLPPVKTLPPLQLCLWGGTRVCSDWPDEWLGQCLR